MKFMNTYDIDDAAREHRTKPVLGKATQFLVQFRDEVNANSDGWAYWPLPARAAKKLITLIESHSRFNRRFDSPEDATEAELRAALSPIKAFYTRRGNAQGMKYPEVNR